MTIKQVARSDVDVEASRLHSAAADQVLEERRRGYGDGTEWASNYASADQLGGFVESFRPGVGGTSEMHRLLRDFTSGTEETSSDASSEFEGPYWEGFLEGAEDVFVHGDPHSSN